MAQKTNLNISPYYDDFESDKNFYKVLYKPGFPVQARELTGSQSILQNQIQSFGDHIFKEGSVVIPGNTAYVGNWSSIKLNAENYGVDISLYIKDFIGKKVTGRSSGINGIVKYVALPGIDPVDDITIYVTYTSADNNNEINPFIDGEQLICSDNVTYGNTTINAETPFASLLTSDATAIGSAVYIEKGVYFIRGYFVNVTSQTIILDYYSNTPSYRIGLRIDELLVNAKDDNSLYDNAKGFNNYAAPGADRLKINLTLVKKVLEDQDDTDFVELLRVKDGKIKKVNPKSDYNIVRDWIAERTFEESGHYTVSPFKFSVLNSLNDNLGNGGLFYIDEKTDQLNTPSDDLMCLKISPGKAYVSGYDVEKGGTNIIDVEKPRDVGINSTASVNFDMANILRVNNVTGVARQGEPVQLWSGFGQTGENIGSARAYNISLRNQEYDGDATVWDLRLFDIQTTTKITLNDGVSASQLPTTSFVKGKNSGASGYAVVAGDGTAGISINQTTGSFFRGEQIEINGVEFPRTVSISTSFNTQSIKSVKQVSVGGYPEFKADSRLDVFPLPNGINEATFTAESGGISTITSGLKQFTGLRTGSTIIYQKREQNGEIALPTYNKVKSIGVGNTYLELEALTGVPGVFIGTLPQATPSGNVTIPIRVNVGAPIIRGTSRLYSPLGSRNISTVDLSNSNLKVTKQYKPGAVTSGTLTVDISNLTSQHPEINSTNSTFEAFDEERYSLHYGDGTIAQVREDAFLYNNSGDQVIFSNLTANANTNTVVNLSVKKNGIQSKIKNYNKSKTLDIVHSKYAASGTVAVGNGAEFLADGLTVDPRYGLRVQDERISLNYPDVSKFIAVYESIDTEKPTLDQFRFSSTASVAVNAVIGENIIGNNSRAIARVVEKSSTEENTLGIVYLTGVRFSEGESVTFEESDINTKVEQITNGIYKDITNSFGLDKGQRDEYYDYSSIVRLSGVSEPSGRLLVVFDYYSVANDDEGDVFTALSYDKDRFNYDIPNIGSFALRASDTIDFRPRVPIYDTATSTLSPFNFDSRDFTSSIKQYMIPNETSSLGYEYYLPRIDKVYLNKFGEFVYQKGLSSADPKAPIRNDGAMELATINLPPYLYNPESATLSLKDNRRYTMRDIGNIEDRVENLEEVTTLSLLESDVQSLQIQDSEGRNRFKTGFFVDPFKNYNYIRRGISKVQVNRQGEELIPVRSRNTLSSQVMPKLSTTSSTIDFNSNFDLFDGSVQKTGDAVTLAYDEEVWFGQYYATLLKDGSIGIINVNPYELPAILGNVDLQPNTDIWTRTSQLEDNTIRQDGTDSNVDLNINASGTIDLGEIGVITEVLEDIRITGIANAGRRGEMIWGQDVVDQGRVNNISGGGVLAGSDTALISNTDVTIQNRLLTSEAEDHMRSRNTEFRATGFTGYVKAYLFIDGQRIDDITPKLLAISKTPGGTEYGSDLNFIVGENVIVEDPTTGDQIMTFRLCRPDHKSGPIANPNEVYATDPYSKQDLSRSYTVSSPILNIDTRGLAEEAQGDYFGYLVANAKLIGEESTAVAYVKDWDNNKLVADEYGDIIGTFFLRDPNAIPQPPIKITTGRKTVRITTSSTNVNVPPGTDPGVVIAEGTYTAQGTFEEWQNDRVITTNTTQINSSFRADVGVEGTIRTQTVQDTLIVYTDPIAQSFVVGGNVQAPSALGTNEDMSGLFITAVEVFFASIEDETNAPIRCEIRTTTGDARPSRTVLGRSRTLYPFTNDENGQRIQNIQTDNVTASVGTKFTFPEPIFLAPGESYAFVLVAERSVKYTVWLAEHGGSAVNPQSIPGSTGESTTYSRQYGAGALFKSQNGALWTEDQTQDLKFILYRAKFKSTEGSVFFNNPDLDESNGFVPLLRKNALRTLPKTGYLRIGYYNGTGADAANTLQNWIKPGRKLVAGTDNKSTAVVESVGSRAVISGASNILDGGVKYPDGVTNAIETVTITGKGSGLKLNVTVTNGVVTNVALNAAGSGYQAGDVVSIPAYSAGGAGTRGKDALISVEIAANTIDTIYLTNIQGESGSTGSWKTGISLKYVNNSGTVVTTSATYNTIAPGYVDTGGVSDGNHLKINQFNHGMYSGTNKVLLDNIKSDAPSSTLTANLIRSETSTISVASTVPFQTFEGIEVNSNTGYIGYVKIGNEIIGYSDVTTGGLSIAAGANGRGVDNTSSIIHEIDRTVEKYELNGVSLRRICMNPGKQISSNDIGMDYYHVEFDNGTTGGMQDRSEDKDYGGVEYPQLSFNSDALVGGSGARASQNLIYSAIVPRYGALTPSGVDGSITSIDASVRTISGSSIDGIEGSFNDQGYKNIQLNTLNDLSDVSIIASKINENEYLSNIPRNKSFTTLINLKSNSQYISPVIYLGESSTEFISYRLDNPIGDNNYPTDNRVNSIIDDPHSAVYYSNTIRLSKPATSLKVMLAAMVPESSDIRVLYRLDRLDSSEVVSEFELFPGYNNLIDNDEDNIGDIVIDVTNNDGRPDSFVPPSFGNRFFDYSYTADNLDLFTGFSIKIIMSGTNQAQPPRIRELRSVAVR